MGYYGEVLTEPAIAASDPVRIVVLCMAELPGKTQGLAFVKEIDANGEPGNPRERDGALNITVNVLHAALSSEVRVGPDRKPAATAASHYWMDSLPFMSNRR
ncbi:MAG: hypothetical protein WCC04_04270 [Terriglobales bacterium]